MMKIFACLAAAAALAAFAGPALAWPATAYTSNELPGDRAQCLAHAQSALTTEGWAEMRPSGGVGWLAHKQPSSAYILCLDAPVGALPPGQAPSAILAIVFVASDGGPEAAGNEAARLQQHMLQR